LAAALDRVPAVRGRPHRHLALRWIGAGGRSSLAHRARAFEWFVQLAFHVFFIVKNDNHFCTVMHWLHPLLISNRNSKYTCHFCTQAADSLSRGMQTAANFIVAIPMEEYERAGIKGYILSMVFQAAPRSLLRPVLGAAQAVSKAALGLRNELSPGLKKESDEKYKDDRRL
jgi:hypothetical protein